MFSMAQRAVVDTMRQLEPGPAPEAPIARAERLRGTLRNEQAAAVERGAYSPELHEAFEKAGFYRALQPRRYGGCEFDVPALSVARTQPGLQFELTAADPARPLFAEHDQLHARR